MTAQEALAGGKMLLASGDGWWDDDLLFVTMARLINDVPGLQDLLWDDLNAPNLWYATATYIHYQRSQTDAHL